MNRGLFEHGLVVGKFYPPHEGHEYLIATALFHCRRVSVLVLGSSAERLSMRLRAQWLRECFPAADGLRVVAELDDLPIDYADPELWRAHVDVMRRGLRRIEDEYDGAEHPVDVVFSSESYGAELARRFGAADVCLDRARALHPISSTAVRADLPASWMHLPAPVRAGLALRVAIVGAESTGTTTLARDLCSALRARGGVWERTQWVPEYGREYSVNLLAVARAHDPNASPTDIEWHEADFAHIAEEQTRREAAAARDGGPVLVCDTDALATRLWHERYLGHPSASVDAIASAMPPRALYLLTDHRGVSFEDDGLRDGEHVREWMTGRFAQVLDAGSVPWRLVTGSREERLAAALRHLAETTPSWWPFLD
ncbi:MAG TPA: AAA family ATPase [Gemmatimonadaceae bacterium]|nr:AAA family ATPase [Gemmatimonadaceae bacterium]